MFDFIFGKVYPIISDLALLVFIIDIIIVIPLAYFKKIKPISGLILILSSYLLGLQLWLSGFMLTLQFYGVVTAIIGVLIFGVGVVPIAMFGNMTHGMWSEFFQLLISLIMVFGFRIFGTRLIEKSE